MQLAAGWTDRPSIPRWKMFPVIVLSALVTSVAWADSQPFDDATVQSIVFDSAGGPPIAKASDLLRHDLNALTGRQPAVTSTLRRAKGAGIIIGLAASPPMAKILVANKLSTSPIDGKWETYGRAVVPAPWDKKRRRW
jgi:hypothetical protein